MEGFLQSYRRVSWPPAETLQKGKYLPAAQHRRRKRHAQATLLALFKFGRYPSGTLHLKERRKATPSG